MVEFKTNDFRTIRFSPFNNYTIPFYCFEICMLRLNKAISSHLP